MKKGLNETRLGAEPIQQLNTNSFMNTDSALSNSGQKDVKEYNGPHVKTTSKK